MSEHDLHRRAFLRSSAVTLAGLGAPWAMNLAGMAQAAQVQAAVTGSNDYKAIVCVFLQGGNDQANTLIPCNAADHALYERLRGKQLSTDMGIDQLQATRLNPSTTAGLPSGLQLALAPKLFPLLDLFDQKRLAVLLNIGPLVKPTTKAEFKNAILGAQDGTVLPPKLFSHNDQQSVWQSYDAEGSQIGWGGLIGDAGLNLNTKASLTCVNLAGNAVYVAGQDAVQFMVNPLGPDKLLAADAAQLLGSAACVTAFRSLTCTEDSSVHRLAKEHSNIMRRAQDTNAILLEALAKQSTGPTIAPLYDKDGQWTGTNDVLMDNPLAAQLNTAVRLMAIRKEKAINVQRQVFFVSLGGFDLHDGLVTQHPKLRDKLAQALRQLDTDLATLGLQDQVTTFTASDFGRTITSNGDGSDHGWGSHHFVMGGAVKGGRFYGEWPEVTDFEEGKHNIGQGRLLPTMSVDHLAVALAQWMQVTDATALQHIAPHLGSFPGVSPLADLF
jgi:uncharacterized protein (DUF1501 family)